jgi:AAHS family 4-hydroxybenzoate transporter-like MFS transporter
MPRYGWTVLFWIGGLVPLTIALGLLSRLPESVKYLATRPLLDRFGVVVIAVLFWLSVPAIVSLGWVQPSFGTLAVVTALAGLGVLGAQFGNNAAAGLLYPTGVRAKGVGWALGIGRFGAILGPEPGCSGSRRVNSSSPPRHPCSSAQ